jgi:serine/threonine-protein kinase
MATEPQKLGKYNIVGKIGKGAMGEVYKGHDPVLNRFVAIKIIAETLGTDADLVERFKREARNAAGLNHPNIITIYDFVEEEGHLYMVMELLEGQDLKELIKSGSPVTMDQILSIMEQIADGLGFAHSRGIIHRDLKPANIHVSKNGQVKILDFGLVHEASSDMTKTGQVMGTPNYMSPEQVQGLRVDPRSDIPLGAVLRLLTRKKPFSMIPLPVKVEARASPHPPPALAKWWTGPSTRTPRAASPTRAPSGTICAPSAARS